MEEAIMWFDDHGPFQFHPAPFDSEFTDQSLGHPLPRQGLVTRQWDDPEQGRFASWLRDQLDDFGRMQQVDDGSPQDSTVKTSATLNGDIIVIGTLPPPGTGSGGGLGGPPQPPTSPNQGTGVTLGEPPPTDGTPGDDLTHAEKCGSEAGAADQIRDAILATDTDGLALTRSYSDVE
jgi:hypothetical protein